MKHRRLLIVACITATFGIIAYQNPTLYSDSKGVIKITLRRTRQVKEILEKIVSPHVAEKLMSSDYEKLKRGMLINAAIMFCDIRNFTQLTEKFVPEEIIKLLNKHFSLMTKIVIKHGGTVDKYIGDAMLVVFNSENKEQSINNAVNAGLEIVKSAQGIKLPSGKSMECGVGISFGEVIAGIIGSEERFDYTVIGDPVNVASRLEGLTKKLDYKIIIPDSVGYYLEPNTKLLFFNLGKHELKGKKEPILLLGCN